MDRLSLRLKVDYFTDWNAGAQVKTSWRAATRSITSSPILSKPLHLIIPVLGFSFRKKAQAPKHLRL